MRQYPESTGLYPKQRRVDRHLCHVSYITVRIRCDDLGDQGDRITKVEQGLVMIIPNTEVGERVTVRLETVQENVGFAEVIKRHHDSPT